MYRRVWALDSDSNTSLRITVLTATLYTGDYFVPPTPARHSDIIYYSSYNKILCTDLCQCTGVRLFYWTLVQFSRTISACIFPAILISLQSLMIFTGYSHTVVVYFTETAPNILPFPSSFYPTWRPEVVPSVLRTPLKSVTLF